MRDGGSWQRGNRLLVVDDEQAVREGLRRMLSWLGCDVQTASTGREAFELYRTAQQRRKPFQAVILDLQVEPNRGGVEIVDSLRHLEPRVQAILITGDTENPVLTHYRDYGFAAALPKPIHLSELRAVLEAILAVPRPNQ